MEIHKLFDNGQKLEWFSNACYQTLDYYIDTNLKVIEDKVSSSGTVDILEIDIFAKEFSSTNIETTLVECKGGCTFNDIHLFWGVASYIKADNNRMIATSKQMEDIKAHANTFPIDILEPLELYNQVDPEREDIFLMYYFWNEMKFKITSRKYMEFHLAVPPQTKLSSSQNKAYSEIRSYYSILSGKVWREPDLLKRANSLLELQNINRDFVRNVARIQELKPANRNSQYYIDSNGICQAAGSLVLDVRLAYITCAVECAITNVDTSTIEDSGFNNLVDKLSSNIELAVLIPKFLQYFINIFGGVYFKGISDIQNICSIINVTTNQFEEIMSLLEEMFTLPELGIQWGFEEDMLVKNLKYTPSLYKAIGIKNRMKFNFDTDQFVNKDVWRQNLEKMGDFQ